MRLKKIGPVFSALLFTAAGVPGAAQPPDAAQPIPSRQLQADLAVLKRAYEALHPGLYRYNTRAQTEATFRELEREFGRDLTLRQAYVALSIFLAKIKCGHSYPNFYNQPKPVADALFKGRDKLPFYFRWLGGRMIVT